MQLVPKILLTLLVLCFTAACSTTQVKTTEVEPLVKAQVELAENELLDVGINVFDPNILNAEEDEFVFAEVRLGEARYVPIKLMETMQRSALWGAVRVVPSTQAAVDVHVNGKIMHSDGESMILEVAVHDATGRHWFDKEYKQVVSRLAYKYQQGDQDPFQGLYNRIANDVAQYQGKLESGDKLNIRTVAELKFAQDFAPESFGGHLTENKKGVYEINRLPSELDPMLQRVRKIRDRDYLFVDALQEYYGNFENSMSSPYKEWRERSYDEVLAYSDAKREGRNRTIAGVAAIIGGILASASNSGYTRASGSVAIGAGSVLISSGISRTASASLHSEALQELGESMGAEITPQVMDLDEKTVTLTGTVETQYAQWRELLREIYAEEVGDIPDLEQATTNDSSEGS